jgi:lysophospholipase L1-like esterase
MLNKIGKWGAILLVLVALIEVVLRFAFGLGSPPLLKKDEKIGYVLQKNQKLHRFGRYINVNSYHQRSEKVALSDSSQFARVLFLGDSVTFGGERTDQSNTYPELFEEQLGRWCSRPVEALNASAGSWGIGNLRAYAEKFGFFGSDLVVLQIGERDLTQPMSDSTGIGGMCTSPRSAPLLAVQEAFKCFGPRLFNRLISWVSWSETGEGKEITPSDSMEKIGEREERQFGKNMEHLQALIGAIRTSGRPVAVLYNPVRNHVGSKGENPPPSYGSFRRWLDRHNVPMIDLQEKWKGDKEVHNYYRDYIHPNQRGNVVLARALSRFVRRQYPKFATN